MPFEDMHSVLDSILGGGGLFGNTSSLGGTTIGLGQINNNSSLINSGSMEEPRTDNDTTQESQPAVPQTQPQPQPQVSKEEKDRITEMDIDNNTAELSELGEYVLGRTEEDRSETAVAVLGVGQAHCDGVADSLSRQLGSLLEFSTVSDTDATRPDVCPRLVVRESPHDRRELLKRLLSDASQAEYTPSFGVSSAYCLQVWKLCEALWGADLDNDGIPGTDIQSKLHRHKCLLQWLKDAVSDITDKELATPTCGEPENELDGYGAKVWSLLVEGRMVEAYKLAVNCGDFNMIMQIARVREEDPSLKSLIQLRQPDDWQECGAEPLPATRRKAALYLLAGRRPDGHLETLDWLRALSATARYLCPQIPTLEEVIGTYESYFSTAEDLDLTTLPPDEMGMQFPAPPYEDSYTVRDSNGSRRVLDLRYELVRARAFNARPKLTPAGYTPDPCDYSLSFLLSSWFGNPSTGTITGAADQLEALGNWHLAVQALAYLPNETVRGHLIRAVISRHVPSEADTPELKSRLELLRRLGVPESWVLLAQAYRAEHEGKPSLEVKCLMIAERWNAAQRVVPDELLEDELLEEAIFTDNLQSVKGILDKMRAATAGYDASGSETDEQAFYYYLRVCHEVCELLGSVEGVSERLEALPAALAAAGRALEGLSPKTARNAAARAEMSAMLLELAQLIVEL